jgi:hypothetical protein
LGRRGGTRSLPRSVLVRVRIESVVPPHPFKFKHTSEPARESVNSVGSEPAKPTPADSPPCTRISASPLADESTPPAPVHSGTATSSSCRTTGKSAAVPHTPCSHWAPGAHSSAPPSPHPARRGSCAAGVTFLPARWSPARSSHGSPARRRTLGSADAGRELSGGCSSSKR